MNKEKILVVDDNVENCSMMADLLIQWGYRVEEAHQGREVLELVKRFKPDLILLDVMLPGMNGFEICKRIKQSPETENIAVIMLTVLDDAEDRTRGIAVGADLFISRPVNYKELHRQIESVLANKRKVMDTESPLSIYHFFLNLLCQLSPELYQNIKQVLHYSRGISKLLGMDEETIIMIELGAVLHGFSYLFGANSERLRITRGVLQPLRVADYLDLYLDLPERSVCSICTRDAHGCRNPVDGNIEGAQIVRVSNLYCELWHKLGDRQLAYKQLKGELSSHIPDCPVYSALAQVLDDEAFVQEFKIKDI